MFVDQVRLPFFVGHVEVKVIIVARTCLGCRRELRRSESPAVTVIDVSVVASAHFAIASKHAAHASTFFRYFPFGAMYVSVATDVNVDASRQSVRWTRRRDPPNDTLHRTGK